MLLTTTTDRHLGVLLQQHHDHMLHLKTLWSNPFGTTAHFEKEINAATEVARSLSGSSLPLLPVSPQSNVIGDADLREQDPIPDDESKAPNLDSDAIMVSDLLATELDEGPQMYVDSDVSIGDHDVQLIWRPVVSSFTFQLHLYPSYQQEDLRIDFEFLGIVGKTTSLGLSKPHHTPRVPHRRQYFGEHDLAILRSGTARLNDVCINGGAALLQAHFDPLNEHCAVLTTFDLVRVRYRASDEDLWRNIHKTAYWCKKTWVLPIHRRTAEHWVICIISPNDRRLLLFDSLAGERPWQRDIKVRIYYPRLYIVQ
jgi:Ulp1 protease family, C-terminal catalytic domain